MSDEEPEDPESGDDQDPGAESVHESEEDEEEEPGLEDPTHAAFHDPTQVAFHDPANHDPAQPGNPAFHEPPLPAMLSNPFPEIHNPVLRDRETPLAWDPEQPKPGLTKYERTRILGVRAFQISRGAAPTVETAASDPLTIARQEFQSGKLPLRIRRMREDGSSEDWKIADLLIAPSQEIQLADCKRRKVTPEAALK